VRRNAGAIGQRLVPQLVTAGHQVTASTRRPDGQARLRAMGAEPAVMDGLDPAAVGEAVARARPEVVIHQMTALAGATNLRKFDAAFAQTNRLLGGRPSHRARAPRTIIAVARWHGSSIRPRHRNGSCC